jgi:hypothetical protein
MIIVPATPHPNPKVAKLALPCCRDFFERVSKFLKRGDSVKAYGIGWSTIPQPRHAKVAGSHEAKAQAVSHRSEG